MLRRVVGGCSQGRCQRPIVMELGLGFTGPWAALITPQGAHAGLSATLPGCKHRGPFIGFTLASDCGQISNAYIYYALR